MSGRARSLVGTAVASSSLLAQRDEERVPYHTREDTEFPVYTFPIFRRLHFFTEGETRVEAEGEGMINLGGSTCFWLPRPWDFYKEVY